VTTGQGKLEKFRTFDWSGKMQNYVESGEIAHRWVENVPVIERVIDILPNFKNTT